MSKTMYVDQFQGSMWAIENARDFPPTIEPRHISQIEGSMRDAEKR